MGGVDVVWRYEVTDNVAEEQPALPNQSIPADHHQRELGLHLPGKLCFIQWKSWKNTNLVEITW
jgi:hypothetical protein